VDGATVVDADSFLTSFFALLLLDRLLLPLRLLRWRRDEEEEDVFCFEEEVFLPRRRRRDASLSDEDEDEEDEEDESLSLPDDDDDDPDDELSLSLSLESELESESDDEEVSASPVSIVVCCCMMTFGAFLRCSLSPSVRPPRPMLVKKLIAKRVCFGWSRGKRPERISLREGSATRRRRADRPIKFESSLSRILMKILPADVVSSSVRRMYSKHVQSSASVWNKCA
jgi:hypothetical protein